MLRHQASDATAPGGPSLLQGASSVRRDGRNAIERKAIARVQREIAAMPASLVVQLALWPDEIASWARAEGTHESLVYNMLARRKPYLRVRERLADRLEVSPAVLGHLVDARRPLPLAKRDPDAVAAPVPAEPPVDWSRPPYPAFRDGSNPVERRAVRLVEREIASMPPAAVVGLALWPTTLAEWSREQRLKSSIIWATLAGSPSERVRAELARRLDVTLRDLDDLIARERAQPLATRVPALSDLEVARPVPRPGDASFAEPSEPAGPAPAAPPRLLGADEPPPPAPDTDQLSLGF